MNLGTIENKSEIEFIARVAILAGDILLRHRNTVLDVAYKVDENDPVTNADRESDEFIRGEIAKQFPDDFLLSEENSLIPESYNGRVWMIDPLDDTKAFIGGHDSFSISIGCVENGLPILGVVYAPAREDLYFASIGHGSYLSRKGIVEKLSTSNLTVLEEGRIIVKLPSSSVRELDTKLSQIKAKEFIRDGSIALAISRVASGDAQCTACTNPSVSKWDTAAAHVILQEAGGIITDSKGSELDYKQNVVNWRNLVAASANVEIHKQFIEGLV